MTAYEIEKDIPMDSVHSKYPFLEMEVGDSFLVAVPVTTAPKTVLNRMRGAIAWVQRKETQRRFIARITDEGVRVWRKS